MSVARHEPASTGCDARERTVGVAGAVDVPVVPRVGLVLDMRRVDGDAAGLLLGRLVDLGVVGERCASALREDFCDGCRQRRLSVVDVAWSYVDRYTHTLASQSTFVNLITVRGFLPIVPMFKCGFVRVYLSDAPSAYPLRDAGSSSVPLTNVRTWYER